MVESAHGRWYTLALIFYLLSGDIKTQAFDDGERIGVTPCY